MQGSKSRLLLLEIIVVVFLFALSSGICLNLFAKAKSISVQSRNLTMAMVQAQRAADAFKSADGETQSLAQLLGAREGSGVVALSYDRDWQPVEEEAGAAFCLEVTVTREGGLARAAIAVEDTHGEIYRLEAAHRVGGGQP